MFVEDVRKIFATLESVFTFDFDFKLEEFLPIAEVVGRWLGLD